MTGARHCAVSDCKSNSHNKTKDIKFFKFPENFNDDWKRVVNKHEDWKPKKSSVISFKTCAELIKQQTALLQVKFFLISGLSAGRSVI